MSVRLPRAINDILALTLSLPSQFFPGCRPQVGHSFAEVPADCLLWCRCTAELHVYSSVAPDDAH